MIQTESVLDVADNSGAKRVRCLKVLGGSKRKFASVGDIIAEGVKSGAFRAVSVAHMLQSLIGLTVYHFASGELGAGLIGAPLLSAEAVSERKREVIQLLHNGLIHPNERPIEEMS